jgi:hypothetical protein
MSRELGDHGGLADALDRAGLVSWARGDLAHAQEALMPALELAHSHRARLLEARILFHLGLVACERSELSQAHEWQTRSLAIADELHES